MASSDTLIFKGIAKKVMSSLKQSADVEHTVILVTPDQKVVALGQFLNQALKITIELDEPKTKKSGLPKL